MTANPTTETQIQDWLLNLIEEHNELNEPDDSAFPNGRYVSDKWNYSDAGIMSCNSGIVLVLSDGTEFQITIVKSA